MELNSLRWVLSILLVSLVSACQKDNSSLSKNSLLPEISSASVASASKQAGGCRLVANENPFNKEYFTYNSDGLADSWDLPDWDYSYKLFYDAKGTLTGAEQHYDGGFSTMKFVYDKKKKVVKDIYYVGNTLQVEDEYYYTYNAKGEIIRSESFINDFYFLYEYTPQGNVSMWELYIGGALTFRGEYTFLFHYKNPSLAVPGIDIGFAYGNPPVFRNKWLSSSEKLTYIDENGNEFVQLDQDPTKTIVNAGHENYVTFINYYDVLSDTWAPFTYTYENCSNDNGAGVAKVNNGNAISAYHSNKKPLKSVSTNIHKFLLKEPGKTMKQKVAEFKKEFM